MMNRKKIISSLLCIMFCIYLTACAGQMSSGDTSAASNAKRIDDSIPEEITMEFFGMNLLEANRPMWEKHIFSLNELGEDDYVYTTFYIGDYEVTHSYLNFENKGNFSSYITYNNDRSGSAQILFDENDNLSKIDIRSDMGEEFSTSFLNIGDNVNEYFEAYKSGLWKEFLGGETMVTTRGWYLRHSTADTSDYTYDVLQVSNSDIALSYMIKDELVDYIMLTVVGDLAVNDELETEQSIYSLDTFDFYVYDNNIASMSASEWLEFFNFSENDELQAKYKEQWLELLDFSDEHFKKEKPETEAIVLLPGKEMGAFFMYYEDYEYKSMMLTMYPVTEAGEIETSDTSNRPSSIDFSISKEGFFNIDLYIEGECPMITSNCIMPGDNIRTFLNSYEDGLYEKIVSLSDVSDEYRIGPYFFRFESDTGFGGNCITIGKNDEKSSLPVSIFFEDEIVTAIHRTYRGRISGFDEKPSLW